jgi:RNA polymerase sigma-54 factor
VLLQQDQNQSQTQRIDPKIILANTILQLNSVELIQSIQQELIENPALEAIEETGCDGNCINPALCPYCSVLVDTQAPVAPPLSTIGFDHEDPSVPDLYPVDDDFDPVGNLEAEMTLAEHLCSQLRTALSAADYPIGEYLVSSLDAKGWLSECPATIASDLQVPEADVMRVLRVLQSLDPPGVGAQTLQECLLLQLRYLREEDLCPGEETMLRTAELLVRDHFESFWKRLYPRLARAARCSPDEAKQASDFVARHLNPFPASQFRPPHTHSPSNARAVVRPDVVIRRCEFGYEVDVHGAEPYLLSVNAQYRDTYLRLKDSRRGHSELEIKHVTEYVERAERFIANIQLRRHTLRRITRCIVDCQTGFLETGAVKFLRPLTRTRVARLLNIHESTVSRATADKFVRLPNQEVVPFDLFFDSSLAIKDGIEELIQQEDPASPLSDQQIVHRLAEQGVTVARRTVVKYRKQQKILSSTRRKR